MSQTSFAPEVTSTALAEYIRKDGTTTTTARIPFAAGLSIPNSSGGGNPAESILIGSNPSPNIGATSQLRIYVSDESLFNQSFIFIPTAETVAPFGASFELQAGQGPSGGVSGGFLLTGGAGNGASSIAGDVRITGGLNSNSGGTTGSVYLAGGNGSGSNTRGYVRVGSTGASNKFTLTNSDTTISLYVEKNLEVDGTTWLDGALNVTGTTTLATSLTGILKATSGVVAAASSADLLSAIGTIDISSNTNLAVSSPITLTGDTVGFSFATNNVWTGTTQFANQVTLKDDTKFFIGSDGTGTGNVSLLFDAGSSCNVQLLPEGGFSEVFEIFPTDHNQLISIGGSLASATVYPTSTSDALSVRKQSSSGAIRGMLIQAEWAGASTSSSAIQGQNIFVSTSTGATGSLTGANALRANRATVRHRATNAGATVANAISVSAAYVQDAGAAPVAKAHGYFAEAPTIGFAAITNNYYSAYFAAGSVTGLLDNNYQIYIKELIGGTNRYEVFLENGGGIFLRDTKTQIYSSASSTLDLDVATTLNLRINGTIEAVLNSSTFSLPSNNFAIASNKRIYFEGPAGDTYLYYDSASSSVKLYVNGSLSAEFT